LQDLDLKLIDQKGRSTYFTAELVSWKDHLLITDALDKNLYPYLAIFMIGVYFPN